MGYRIGTDKLLRHINAITLITLDCILTKFVKQLGQGRDKGGCLNDPLACLLKPAVQIRTGYRFGALKSRLDRNRGAELELEQKGKIHVVSPWASLTY